MIPWHSHDMGTPACRQRRQPEATTLHRVLSAHLQTFLARADDAGGEQLLPLFVVRELTACGHPRPAPPAGYV